MLVSDDIIPALVVDSIRVVVEGSFVVIVVVNSRLFGYFDIPKVPLDYCVNSEMWSCKSSKEATISYYN